MTTALTTDEPVIVTGWPVEKLKALNRDQSMELFHTLSAPSFSEMDGEYEAHMLDNGSATRNALARLVLYTPFLYGRWLCKAFRPGSETRGHGYNSFRKFGKVTRRFPMKTGIVPSRYDGKDVFQLYYPAYRSITGFINMVDEIRKIRDGLYLGIGTWGFSKKQRMIPYPFCLSGPIAEFAGFPGEELKLFQEKIET